MQDGECVSVPQCGVCTDEQGYARYNGEQWRYYDDACTVATCMPDSSIVQSQIECAAPPSCMSNEVFIYLSFFQVNAYVKLICNH